MVSININSSSYSSSSSIAAATKNISAGAEEMPTTGGTTPSSPHSAVSIKNQAPAKVFSPSPLSSDINMTSIDINGSSYPLSSSIAAASTNNAEHGGVLRSVSVESKILNAGDPTTGGTTPSSPHSAVSVKNQAPAKVSRPSPLSSNSPRHLPQFFVAADENLPPSASSVEIPSCVGGLSNVESFSCNKETVADDGTMVESEKYPREEEITLALSQRAMTKRIARGRKRRNRRLRKAAKKAEERKRQKAASVIQLWCRCRQTKIRIAARTIQRTDVGINHGDALGGEVGADVGNEVGCKDDDGVPDGCSKRKRAERRRQNNSSASQNCLSSSNSIAVPHQEPEPEQNDEYIESSESVETPHPYCNLSSEHSDVSQCVTAVGDVSVITCDVANASSGTHSNEENIDPVLCLSELAGLDPSDAAYAIKEIRSQQNALLANCQTDVGDVYGDIKEDDSICSRQDESMQVFVRTPDGKTITFSVNQSTTVADLKRDISSKTYTPIDGMRVCYGGKLLIDGQTVFEYGITRDSTLDLHDAGLKGGSRGGDECPGTPGFDVALHDLENARQQLEDWSEHCSRQEKEINRLRQQADSARVALNESEEYRQELEQRSSSVTRENATLRESNAAQEEQLVSARYILSTLSEEFRDLRETNCRLTAELATQRQQVDSSTILQRQLDEMRSENDGLVSDVNTSRETIDRLRIEKTLQRETIDGLRLSLDEMGTERDGLLAYLDTARGTIDGLRLEIEEIERAITASEETNSTLRATKDHLRLEVLEKDQVIAELERRVARINEIDEQNEKFHRDNTYLCAESKRLKSDLKVTRLSIQRLEQENANLRERLNSSSAENTQQQTLLNDFANAATTHAEGLQAAVVQRDQTITERDQEIQRLKEQIQRLQSQQCETVEQPRDRFDSTSVTPAPSRRGDGGSSLAPSLPSATAFASASDPSSPSVSATASSSSIEGTSNETPRNPGDFGEEERAEFLEQMDRAGLLGDQSEAAVVDDDSHGDPPSLPSSSSATAASSSSTTGSLLTKRVSLESDSDNSHSDSSEDGAIEPKAKKSKNSVEETSSESLSLHPVAGGVVVGGYRSRRSTKVVDYRKSGVLKDLGSHDAKVLAEREARDTSDDSSDDDNSNDDDSRFMTQDTTTSSASSAVATSSGDTAVDDSFSMSSQSSIMTPTPSTLMDSGTADGTSTAAYPLPTSRADDSRATPVARRSQQITSPLLSPIEKDSKRVQEEVDTTLDTVDLTDVSDDTVQYDDEVSSSTSTSGAMIFHPSRKYDSVCPRSLEAILESLDVTKEELQKYPHLYHALTTFHTKEIEPAMERARAANAQNAQAISDAAAAVNEEEDEASDEEENDWTVGSTIRLDDLENLPQDRAVLGLRYHHSKAMDDNPKTEGHAIFMKSLKEYSEQFQRAKRNTKYTKNDVVAEMYKNFVEKYDFIVLSMVADSEGEYYVVEKSDFVKDASLYPTQDTGSIRTMLYYKLSNYPRNLGSNSLANVLQGKIDYFEGLLTKCTLILGYDSAKDFIPHFELSDEKRKDPNFGADEHDSTLEELKETYSRPPTVPSEEHEENIHLMPIEVAIIHRDLIELILSLHNDYANRNKWKEITERVVAEDAIPSQLQALFVRPDLEDRPSRRVGEYLINLIKVLSLQCGMSGYKISECGSKEELASLELDHILKYFRKSHNCTDFYAKDTTSHSNPFGLDNILKRALYETFKCRLLHFMQHLRGNDTLSEAKLQERMCRKLVLTYDNQVEKILGLFEGNPQSVTFRKFCQIKEFVLLMLDWLSRGAFRQTKKPLVSYKALAIAPMKLFHVSLEDIMKYTEDEYNQLNTTTRAVAVTNAVGTLMARLSGGCSRHIDRGCKLNRAEMNSGQLQASMEMNHRDRNAKDKTLSALRNCPVKWCKEGIRGDCEHECRCCHKKISAFQSGGPKPPGYTGR